MKLYFRTGLKSCRVTKKPAKWKLQFEYNATIRLANVELYRVNTPGRLFTQVRNTNNSLFKIKNRLFVTELRIFYGLQGH